MIRPTVARVDLRALQGNFRRIAEFLRHDSSSAERRRASRRAPAMIAVVKANAYGHGAVQVARALEDAGADLVACADIEEGAALRGAGVRAEILVFGALSVSDLDGLFDCALTPTISTPGAARAVRAAAEKYRRAIHYHLKIDTGMNRLGFRSDNLRRTLPDLLASHALRLDAVYTHFATADVPGSPVFDRQRERFETAVAEVQAIGGRPEYLHAANSAALLRDSRVWFDRVRPGLLLYGIVPPPLASTKELTPVM
jgi:alanine racemase